ncbi:MAG: hypothetical protein WCG32_00595 [Actinomycetes bacterium]
MKKNIFATAVAVVLAFTLAACSSSAGAKQIVLHLSGTETGKYTIGERANVVGTLDLADAKATKLDVLIEEQVPGGSWTEFRKFTASKSSSSIGFALVKNEAGKFKYRATISADGYGPFTSAEFSLEYSAKK